MQWNNDIDLSERQFTARLIIQRSLLRGWRVAGFDSNPAIIFIYPRPDSKPVKVFSALTPDTSYISAKIARDKHITSELLSQGGMAVPAELLLTEKITISDEKLTDFIDKHTKIVVKPLDAAHGKGITMGVNSLTKLHKAIDYAASNSPSKKVLIQEELYGHDIRIVTLGYEFLESMSRIPPHVIGDGQHTIRELVEEINQHEDRGETYKSRLAKISLDKAEAFLEPGELDRIASADEEVQVIGISNIGTGGTRENTKKTVPEFLINMAITAAKIMELPVCGVDFIVAKKPLPTSTPEELQAKVIEVNSCPSLTHYEDLNSEDQLMAIDKYLDYIESIK